MKKMALAIVCIVFYALLSGCASLRVERLVQDNVFYSSYPQYAIKVDPEIKFVGKVDNSMYRQSDTDPLFSANIKSDAYFFAQIKDNRVNKGVLIKFDELNTGYWLPDLFDKVKTKLVSGVTKINEVSYQYVITNMPMANTSEIKYITDKGYITSNCYLWKALKAKKSEQVLLSIIYTEDISNNEELKGYKCFDWNKSELLLEDQKKFLREFNLRADKNIEILKVSNIPQYTEKVQSEDDVELKLKKVKELFDKGLINQEEYNNKKAELLKKY